MKIINKTPHPINIVNENNEIITVYPKSDSLIRLGMQTIQCDPLPDGTPTSRTQYGNAEGLPEYSEGTFYIVSQLIKSALPERTDLLVPAEVVRDETGNIIGCKSLGR